MNKPLALATVSMFQIAYVVPHLGAGIEVCKRLFGIEEFLEFRDVRFDDNRYRGQPSTDARQHLAFGFSGSTNIELIQPIEGASVYTEFLDDRPDGGFHHIGYKVANFEHAVKHLGRDFQELQSACFGEATRFAYFDTRPLIGHLIEILSFDKSTEAMFEQMRAACFR